MGVKKTIRIMGHFEQASRRKKATAPKRCRNCGRPVRETVGDCGYCRRCIVKAKEELKDEG